jgi:hypothetical protein
LSQKTSAKTRLRQKTSAKTTFKKGCAKKRQQKQPLKKVAPKNVSKNNL